MTGLYVLAALVLVLFLIGQVRVGGQVEYSREGLTAWVRAGAFLIQVFPWNRPKKEKKAKKEKPKKKEKKKKEPAHEEKPPAPSLVQKAGGALEYAQALLPIALQAAGQFQRKLQVDTLDLTLTVGGDDPADIALLYGRANAVLGSLWDPLVRTFHVKKGRARAEVDFQAAGTTLYAKASLSLKIGQILWLGLFFGLRTLRAALAVRKEQKNKKRKAA